MDTFLSDAALLELLSPIVPLPNNLYFDSLTFKLQYDSGKTGALYPDSSPPGCRSPMSGKSLFNALDFMNRGIPLQLPQPPPPPPQPSSIELFMSAPGAAFAAARNRAPKLGGPESASCSKDIEVEQIVQVCGLTSHASADVDNNWARVVRRQGEFYLVSVFSDQHLVGGPVRNSKGQLIAVASEYAYKNGTQSAFFLASFNDLNLPSSLW
jgi:hypothetical protein